jgi:hypothetical protein
VVFYGLASRFVGEIVEFFPSREAAEVAVEHAISDSPELNGDVYVETVDFDVASAPDEGPAWSGTHRW